MQAGNRFSFMAVYGLKCTSPPPLISKNPLLMEQLGTIMRLEITPDLVVQHFTDDSYCTPAKVQRNVGNNNHKMKAVISALSKKHHDMLLDRGLQKFTERTQSQVNRQMPVLGYPNLADMPQLPSLPPFEPSAFTGKKSDYFLNFISQSPMQGGQQIRQSEQDQRQESRVSLIGMSALPDPPSFGQPNS